jgi:5'-AMP-activated protein kinase, regulatory beta subunit
MILRPIIFPWQNELEYSIFQSPVTPLQRAAEVPPPVFNQILMNQQQEDSDGPPQKKIPTLLMWTLGGRNIYVEGSWDNWTSKYSQTKNIYLFPFSLMPLKPINRREFILTADIYIHGRKLVEKSGKDHTILLMLSSGVHRYRFIVDGERRFIPDLPCETDNMGQIVNLVDVHVSVSPFTLNI